MVNTEELAHELVAGFSSVPVPRHSPFWQSDHPVLWLAAHDLVRNPETYYRDLAEAFGMEFTSELPVMMDDSASVANIVGPSVLTRLSFFLYREREEVVVACADPFLAAEIEATCRACVGEDATLRFVMASLASIRQAIAHSTYLTTRARAETGLSFGAPEYSSRGIISNAFRLRLLVIVAANIGLLIWQPTVWLVVFFILTNALYFLLTPFRLAVCLRAVRFSLPAAEWSGGCRTRCVRPTPCWSPGMTRRRSRRA